MDANLVIDAIMGAVKRWLYSRDSPVPQFYTCKYISTESGDSDLSQVTLPGGNTARWVRKVGSATYSSGNVVLCIRAPGVPLTILGQIRGNITIADDGLGPYVPPSEPDDDLSHEETA